MSVKDEFARKVEADELCAKVLKAVRENDEAELRRMGFGEFARYAGRLSELMTASVREGLDWSPDFAALMRQVNSPVRYAHHLVNEAGVAVQTALDEQKGVRLRAVQPDYNDGRTKAIVGEAAESDSEHAADNLATQLGTEVKDAGNEFMKQNAEQRSRAGFKVTVERTGGVNCCPWCADRIGRWELKDAPDDVFGVHDNCTCMVAYTDSRGVRSQRLGRSRFVEVNYTPTRLTDGAERGAGEPIKIEHITGSAEIEFSQLDGSSKVSSSLLEQYRLEYDKFATVFGNLSLLMGFNVTPYKEGMRNYGGYNPTSREITLVGVGGKSGLGFITQVAKEEKKKGEWSTASPYHTFRHELGHALYAELQANDPNWERKLNRITDIYNEAINALTNLEDNDKIAIKRAKLSTYGFQSVKEFISESVAEYINSPKKSRTTAKTIAQILLQQEWEE